MTQTDPALARLRAAVARIPKDTHDVYSLLELARVAQGELAAVVAERDAARAALRAIDDVIYEPTSDNIEKLMRIPVEITRIVAAALAPAGERDAGSP